jgi:hypothetical protein
MDRHDDRAVDSSYARPTAWGELTQLASVRWRADSPETVGARCPSCAWSEKGSAASHRDRLDGGGCRMRVTPGPGSRGGRIHHGAGDHLGASDRRSSTHRSPSGRCTNAAPNGRPNRAADRSPAEPLRRTSEPVELQLLRGRHDQLTTEQLLQLLQLHPVLLAVDEGVR